jgi:hypothetical protein
MAGAAMLSACQVAPSTTETEIAISRAPITAFEAGSRFAPICQVIYPNISASITAAQRQGFILDSSTGLFEHQTDDVQMRINKAKCSLRFLTSGPEQAIVPEFAGGAARSTTNLANDQNVSIGTEDAGNGLTRAAATRTFEN